MKLILYSFRRTFDFKGRSKKNEFLALFWAQLIVKIIFSALGIILNRYNFEEYYLTWLSILKWIVIGLFLFPLIAVSVRRMHDLGKSGWFLLILIYNLTLACTPGVTGDNEYGNDPKAN